MLAHLILHIPEAFLYLAGSPVNRNDEIKNQPVKQVSQKSIK
jgi:hypothetical protein